MTNKDSEMIRTERLATVGRLWTYIDYFHPDTEQNANWESGLIKALSKISAKMTTRDYVNTISEMLNCLNDPSTSLSLNGENFFIDQNKAPLYQLDVSGVSVITLRHSDLAREHSVAILDNLVTRVLETKAIVLDLRESAQSEIIHCFVDESKLARALTDREVVAPRECLRYYHGLEPSVGTNSGGYAKFKKPFLGSKFLPLDGSKSKQVVFIVNRHSCLPSIALAMQFAGTGYIIADGDLYANVGNKASIINIPDVGAVYVRISEFGAHKASVGGFKPNETVSINQDIDVALKRAIAVAQSPTGLIDAPYRPVNVVKGTRSTSRQSFPNYEQRLRGAFKIWAVFNYFFPYRHLMQADWDQVLLDSIPLFEQCQCAREYALTVTQMVSHAGDSHVNVLSDELNLFFGQSLPPFKCRFIEGKAVITAIENNAREQGLRIGDVVLTVDGQSVFDRLNQFRKYVSASTVQSEQLKLMSLIFRGAENSKLSLTIFDGEIEKSINITRERNLSVDLHPGGALKELAHSIGYADLSRIKKNDIGAMFDRFKDMRGIIFDVRGYPHGTMWDIASRLVSDSNAGHITSRGKVQLTSVPAALFKCPLQPNVFGTPYREFVQTIPFSNEFKYNGNTVMLIDERTISQAEHTGLFLKAANGTTLVGSPTAGANGDVTNFSIPGRIRISLSGQSVEHPNGQQLQRIGLVPDINVSPTINGLRAGKDEVLDCAIDYLLNTMVG